MKKYILNTCALLLMALCALPAMAQLNGDGYYRVRNAQNTNHIISLANDRFTYQSIIGVAGGASNAINSSYWPYMLNCACAFLKNDIHLISETNIISPAAVIYADKKNTSSGNYDYNLIAQGTSLLSMTTGKYHGDNAGDIPVDGKYIQIQKVDGNGATTRYKATIELKASYLFFTINMGTRNFCDENGNFGLCEDVPENAMWYVDPINHFNVFPQEFNGKYIATLKVPFEWKVEANSGVKAVYIITGVTDGVLQYKEITGTIPAGTPVILECTTNDPAQCKLVPLSVPKYPTPSTNNNYSPAADTTSYYTGTNLLGGTYYCNFDGNVAYQKSATATASINGNHFTITDGKYELGMNDDGQIGFVEAQGITTPQGKQVMPANEAWMEVGGVFPSVATPTISPAGDTYNEAQSVTITAEEGATILYSTDGGATWNEYNEAIPVGEGTTTIQAKAIKQGLYNDSKVISATYTVEIPTPELSMTPESMTISDAAAGVFTITGTNVNGNINANLANNTDWYLNPETLSNTGGEVNVTYTGRALTAQNTVNAYVANNPDVKASANVNYKADVYIVTDNGVEGQWNFDNGTQMADEDGIYTATFTATVPNTFILFARKLGDGVSWNTRYVFGPSSEGDWVMPANMAEFGGYIDTGDDDPIKLPYAGEYTIIINANNYSFNIIRKIETVATPTFTPAAGTYTGTQTVTIECETVGATILYKIGDGEYQTYTAPIEINESCTITAKATKDGWNDSEETTAEYIIEIPVVHEPGDVNHDGAVNIKDVTDLIDYLLGSNNEVCEVCANVKDDGAINIADVTALIDLLLNNPAE